MRQSVKEFVSICARNIEILEPIYEFGALQVEDQVGFADLRPLFSGKKYFGADMRLGPGVDIRLNLHQIELPDETAGTVLLMETLEHVEFARKAVQEVHRILKPGGVAIMSSVMNFPVHAYPDDYWRYTPSGFRSLLSVFPSHLVFALGRPSFPENILGVGFKTKLTEPELERVRSLFVNWDRYWNNQFRIWLKGLVRPFASRKLFEFYQQHRDARAQDGGSS